MAAKALVELENVQFARGPHTVLDGVDLRITQGAIVSIMGASGGGKTTLLNLMAGTLAPQAGRIRVAGQDLQALNFEDLYRLRRRMGMLFQHSALFTDFSAFENVAFPLRRHFRLDESILRKLVLMKLEAVGLRGAAGLMPAELSGGMGRRVALARAMVMDPMLIFYDEPFTGLDPISVGIIATLIRRLNDALGATSILVSHDVQETFSITDYGYILAGGKIIAEGTPDTLRASDSELARQFLGVSPMGRCPSTTRRKMTMLPP
ncbi:putative phospholipid import ATP-binding protein MlaF [Acidithiobacillus ferridurans]|uniref:Putative phospholipid import ATP-binding protein MlaF n=1 Tax=Acidithiobacillus ferridurans TaxID=1232575 RepID=A0A2Z6IKC7_ACIFI|nr:ABC transporter ATP-binding protein [Acidithiobacillus ferridurans]BBF65034.1 putative phospholipid import ATP-binding protein MlaF [Acidithiobacillus ferridurans]